MNDGTRPRVRLVKAVIQLHFNYDDGENLREIQGVRPLLIEARDWPEAVEEQYAALVDELERGIADILKDEAKDEDGVGGF
jgi:hypothetical protein